jgi:uncharacterized membrane protein
LIILAYSKERFDFFSDGVIAIIITIMVLEIPLSNTFNFKDIINLLQSIIIFFTSFLIVGSFWNKHNFLLNSLEALNSRIIWMNHLFLYFLALMPIFTKWVLENPHEIVPVFSYDILFLLVNISFVLLAKAVVSDETLHRIHEKNHQDEKSVISLIIMALVVFLLLIITILVPKISIFLFIGFPIISSLLSIVDKDKLAVDKFKLY